MRFVNADRDTGIVPINDVSCTENRVSAVADASSAGILPITPCEDSSNACNAVSFETSDGMKPNAAVAATLRYLPATTGAELTHAPTLHWTDGTIG